MRRQSFSCDRKGSVAIEFALVALALTMFLLGTLDAGRYEATSEQVRVAGDTAARYGMVAFSNNYTAGCAAVPSGSTLQSSVVQSQGLALLVSTSLTLSMDCTGPDINGVLTLTARASYPFRFVTPMFSSSLMMLSSTTSIAFNFPEH